MCLHVLGVNVLQLSLGMFEVNMKNEWIKLGEGGLQIYSRGTWSMSKNKTFTATRKECVG